jgi:uncharacterized phiE125 gp8 family phage protein
MITLADAKTYLQITGSDDDTLLQMYIDDITAEFEEYTDNIFVSQTFTNVPVDTIDQPREVILDAFPVDNVVVAYDGSIKTENEDYYLSKDSGAVYLEFTSKKDSNTLVVSYTAGYEVTATSSDVPRELQALARKALKEIYEVNGKAKKGKGDLKSKRLDAFSVTYGDKDVVNITKTILDDNKLILNKYMRVCVY